MVVSMDPLSIATFAAGGAKALYQVVAEIRDFRKAVKQIDQSVGALENLCHGLAGKLQQLEHALKDHFKAESNGDLLISVHDSVDECQKTIQELEDKLAPVIETRPRPAGQVRRTWAFLQQHAEVSQIVSRMKTHSIFLQFSLQIVLCVDVKLARAEQIVRLDRLELMVERLGEIAEEPHPLPRSKSFPAKQSPVRLNKTGRKLYERARSVISSSEVATRSSTTDDPRELPLREQIAFEDLAGTGLLADLEAQRKDKDGQNDYVHDWLARAPPSIHVQTADQVSAKTSGKERTLSPTRDEIFTFRFTGTLFKRGMEYYDQRRWADARNALQSGIERSASLESEQKEQLNLARMQYTHALCCIVESSLIEAEDGFRLVAEGTASTEDDAKLRCSANYHLAELQLRAKKPDAAEVYCLRANRQMLEDTSIGPNHKDYHQGLLLLALIYWAQGERIKAMACSDLLPPEWQIDENEFEMTLHRFINPRVPASVVSGHTNRDTEHAPSTTPATSIHGGADFLLPSRNSREDGTESLRPASSQSTRRRQTQDLDSELLSPLVDSDVSRMRREELALNIIATRKFIGKSGEHKGLRYACEKNLPDLLDRLLDHSEFPIEINKQRNSWLPGFSAAHEPLLILAASKGNPYICNRLIQSGAEVNIRFKGQSALDAAIKANHLDVCNLLLEHEADVNVGRREHAPLEIAISFNRLDIAKALLQSGADVNAIFTSTYQQMTPLEKAIRGGLLDMYKLLLDFGAVYQCADDQSMSPLALAAQSGHVLICKELVRRGASIDEPDFECTKLKRSALMRAAFHNQVPAIEFLLRKGAKVDGPRPEICTPLMEAAKGHAFDACRFLLEKNASHDGIDHVRKAVIRDNASWWLVHYIKDWPMSKSRPPPEYLIYDNS